MTKEIYLDNAATTKPCAAAVNAMIEAAQIYGNPSSLHGMGFEAEKRVEAARKTIANILGVGAKNLLFTSGGTEANNTAIFGAARAKKKIGTRIITSATEHPSVLEPFKQLEKEGFDVVFVGSKPDGRIDMDNLSSALDENTTLVSVMRVNNETGIIQPIEEIKVLIKERAGNALLHCDCVQAFCKMNIRRLDADLITVSAHKIHGFKGTGALYAKNFRMIRPLIYGGEQQWEMRPGTENVGGILAFAAAAESSVADNMYLLNLRNIMKEELSVIENIKFNGDDKYACGSVLNVSFIGIKAEILLHSLEARGIYVSTGSACSSHKPQPSHVLTAMGLGREEINGAIRISFDRENTVDEIKEAARVIVEEVGNIRRYM